MLKVGAAVTVDLLVVVTQKADKFSFEAPKFVVALSR